MFGQTESPPPNTDSGFAWQLLNDESFERLSRKAGQVQVDSAKEWEILHYLVICEQHS